jgi:hypothetical protein
MFLGFLVHLVVLVIPLHHHDRNYHLNRNYLTNHWFLVRLAIPLHHHDLNYHLNRNYLTYHWFLVHLVIPLLHHDHHDLNYQMFLEYPEDP